MIEQEKGSTITFCCDGCGEILDTDTEDFNEARSYLRVEHWITRKTDQNWVHYCPACQRE